MVDFVKKGIDKTGSVIGRSEEMLFEKFSTVIECELTEGQRSLISERIFQFCGNLPVYQRMSRLQEEV